ncbi:MAG: hypothetical protein M3Q91_16990 [Acidobacteriota bacterium]|nr:hypothetical protein [Acidobacteriota bacterium]
MACLSRSSYQNQKRILACDVRGVPDLKPPSTVIAPEITPMAVPSAVAIDFQSDHFPGPTQLAGN